MHLEQARIDKVRRRVVTGIILARSGLLSLSKGCTNFPASLMSSLETYSFSVSELLCIAIHDALTCQQFLDLAPDAKQTSSAPPK